MVVIQMHYYINLSNTTLTVDDDTQIQEVVYSCHLKNAMVYSAVDIIAMPRVDNNTAL